MKTINELKEEFNIWSRNSKYIGDEPLFTWFQSKLLEHDRELWEAMERKTVEIAPEDESDIEFLIRVQRNQTISDCQLLLTPESK